MNRIGLLSFEISYENHQIFGFESTNVVGIGLNQAELEYNSMLGEFHLQDLNQKPILPFTDQTFAVVVITVSIQYLTKPILIFQEINRILKGEGLLIIFYSNRMFPTKAIAVWHQTDEAQKKDLITNYFQVGSSESGEFMPVHFLDITPETQIGTHTDPVYVAMAKKTSR